MVTLGTMDGMDAKTARTINIRAVVAASGGPTAFAERSGGKWTQAQISQWISEKNPKGIGHNLAREIEKRVGQPAGWLDQNHLEFDPATASAGATASAEMQVIKGERAFLRPITVWNDPSDLPSGMFVWLPKIEYMLSAGPGGPDPNMVEQTEKSSAFSASFAERFGWSAKTHWTMQCKGDSMDPVVQDGAPVVIALNEKQIINGKVYAILIDGDPRLKYLFKHPGGVIHVRSENDGLADYAPFDVRESEIEIIGRAVWTPHML